jgi:DUF971 family protein
LETVKPAEILVSQKEKEITVHWDDGHTSVYSFSLLRHACPCAECRGGHENMGSEPDPAVFDLPDEDSTATHLKNVEAVGSYGITITWEDGHDFGIYTWKYLRALCPCPECRALRN